MKRGRNKIVIDFKFKIDYKNRNVRGLELDRKFIEKEE